MTRGKVAVCLSGRFPTDGRARRDSLTHLNWFLENCDHDLFLHGWTDVDDQDVRVALKPRRERREDPPDFTRLAARIKRPETNTKPGRDRGTLAMLRGMAVSLALAAAEGDAFAFVCRIRPDFRSDRRLGELIDQIHAAGAADARVVFVPPNFHSQGVNDQLAIGRPDVMTIYAGLDAFAREHIESIYFNPEFILLTHLGRAGVGIALLDMEYLLLRGEPHDAATLARVRRHQAATWYARALRAPRHRDLARFFDGRRRAVAALVPARGKVRVITTAGGRFVVRNEDLDPVAALTPVARVGGLLVPKNPAFWFRAGGDDRVRFLSETADGAALETWRLDGRSAEVEVTPCRIEATRPGSAPGLFCFRLRRIVARGLDRIARAVRRAWLAKRSLERVH